MLSKLTRIVEDIYLVRGNNNGRFPFSHSILITTGQKEAVLIDTGCGIDILTELEANYSIHQIINSHTHPDHSAGNWVFEDSERIDVPKEGFSTSGNIFALSERFVEPGRLAKYWRGLIGGNMMNFQNRFPTHSFDEKTIFETNDLLLNPIWTPGHTKDHYCFYEPNHHILFSFDCDLTSFGPWYGHRESSIGEFKNSITNKIKKLKINILVSSHLGIITDQIQEKINEFYSKFDERKKKIRHLVNNGSNTIEQLVSKAPIYGDFPYAKPLLRYWEGEMIKKHIIELQELDELIEHNFDLTKPIISFDP